MARHLLKYGQSASDFSIGVWEYYHNGRASQRITQFAKLYEHFGRLDLSGNAFPLPLSNLYSYRSTWGTGRSWGGARIHEGTDLFAPQGVPVRSTCFGLVETKAGAGTAAGESGFAILRTVTIITLIYLDITKPFLAEI